MNAKRSSVAKRFPAQWMRLAVIAGAAMLAAPGLAAAQNLVLPREPLAVFDPDESVVQYDLAGPRLGMTFLPNGKVRSLFGWHLENQAAPGSQGPWLIVERIFLVGGLEDDAFVPSGTLMFGMRLPSSLEFGVGPSVTIGPGGLNTAIVVAAGQSFRAGGIRIPVNLAVALEKDGQSRVTLITGWAIRDRSQRHEAPPRELPNHSRLGGDI